ncbi:hypothetical protein [Aliidongia dinghuensis]|nr:hypothetical protein [Aliidongia dinghuensis]
MFGNEMHVNEAADVPTLEEVRETEAAERWRHFQPLERYGLIASKEPPTEAGLYLFQRANDYAEIRGLCLCHVEDGKSYRLIAGDGEVGDLFPHDPARKPLPVGDRPGHWYGPLRTLDDLVQLFTAITVRRGRPI